MTRCCSLLMRRTLRPSSVGLCGFLFRMGRAPRSWMLTRRSLRCRLPETTCQAWTMAFSKEKAGFGQFYKHMTFSAWRIPWRGCSGLFAFQSVFAAMTASLAVNRSIFLGFSSVAHCCGPTFAQTCTGSSNRGPFCRSRKGSGRNPPGPDRRSPLETISHKLIL